MARGYNEDEVPRRPTRRTDSRRSERHEEENYGYSSEAWSQTQQQHLEGSRLVHSSGINSYVVIGGISFLNLSGFINDSKNNIQ
jgi:hypothetical protein